MNCKPVKVVIAISILIMTQLWSYSPYQHAYEKVDDGILTWDEYQDLIERIEYAEWAEDSVECEALFDEFGIVLDTGDVSHTIRAEYSFHRDIERDSLLRSSLSASLATQQMGVTFSLYPHTKSIQSRSMALKNGRLRAEIGSISLRHGSHSISAPRVLNNSESSMVQPKKRLNGGLIEYIAEGTLFQLGGSYKKYRNEDGVFHSKLAVVSVRKEIDKGYIAPMIMYGHIYSSDYLISQRMPLGGLSGEIGKGGRVMSAALYNSGSLSAMYGEITVKSTMKKIVSKLAISYRTSSYRDFVFTRVGYEKDTIGGVLVINKGQELLVTQSHNWSNSQWKIRYTGSTSINKRESVFHRSRLTTVFDLGKVKGRSIALWSDMSQSGVPLVENHLTYHHNLQTVGVSSTIHNRTYKGNRWLPFSIFLARSLPYLFDDRVSMTLPRLDYRTKQIVLDYTAECTLMSKKRLNFEIKISLEMYDFKKVTRPKLFFKMSTAF
ncbi:MAG: hypothetical protein OCC49_17380 [Fibrobacterales bacterium]